MKKLQNTRLQRYSFFFLWFYFLGFYAVHAEALFEFEEGLLQQRVRHNRKQHRQQQSHEQANLEIHLDPEEWDEQHLSYESNCKQVKDI